MQTGSEIRIVGISLLRNEEYFSAWAIGSAVDFCDEFLVMDNRSSDGTRQQLEQLAAKHPQLRLIDVEDAYDTHKYVEPYADSPTWVFGVDGDEIYDPAQLAELRGDLKAGRYAKWWRLDSHTLHVTKMSIETGRAHGHLAPPSRPMSKLFNFNAIRSWRQGRHQRLHGKDMVFKQGFDADSRCREFLEADWPEARLRCLHLCFMQRSPLDGAPLGAGKGRPNPSEIMKSRRWLAQLGRLASERKPRKTYKDSFYAVGPVAEVDVAAFGVPSHPQAAIVLNNGIE